MNATNEPAETIVSETVFEGGCLCGAVRYRVRGAPVARTLCHCATCRRAAAAPSVAWAIFKREDFELVAGAPKEFHSSPHIARGFCETCGTQLTYRSERRPEVMDITTVSLDAPETCAPEREIWTEEKLAWEVVNPSLPQYLRSSKG